MAEKTSISRFIFLQALESTEKMGVSRGSDPEAEVSEVQLTTLEVLVLSTLALKTSFEVGIEF